MSLRTFLSCGYALLVEAHQQVGADMVSAVERADASIFGTPIGGGMEHVPTESENEAALAELQKMMMGL